MTMTSNRTAPGPRQTAAEGTEAADVLVLLSSPGDQRLLIEWLEERDEYTAVSGSQERLAESSFDLCILDEQSLQKHAAVVYDRREAGPGRLPVLLVSTTDFKTAVSRVNQGVEYSFWELVDEMLPTPIEYVELAGRLENLRRLRSQSVDIEQKTEQLLLLNRITRHDIRNEMSVILGWTTELTAHVDDEGEAIRKLLLDSADHVVELTRDVRAFVEVFEEGTESELDAVSFNKLLEDEVKKRRQMFGEADFRLDDGGSSASSVYGDTLLSSVFRNVLNNAVQHNDAADPVVEITVGERERTVSITVADNGPGIPEDQRDAVLGRTSRGIEHPSAGIGLYLVDTLVDRYGGSIRIDDAELGGTAVEVRLRKAPDTEEASP